MPTLTDVIAKYADHGDSGLLPAAQDVFYHGHLVEYLHDIVDSRHQGNQDFPVGYKHPNGFTKIRLTRLEDSGWTVRLHVWDPLAAEADIHDHRWHFASCVVVGSIAEQRYVVAGRDGPWTMHDCSPSHNGEYALANARPCRVQLIAEDRHRSGDSYQRSSDVLHVVRTEDHGPAVTLFVQGRQTKNMTTVLTGPGRTVGDRKPLQGCDDVELQNELRNVLKLMSNA